MNVNLEENISPDIRIKRAQSKVPFILPKNCRKYFQNIFDPKNKDGTKLNLYFDEYYFCLLAGLSCGKYDSEPELDSTSQMDEYPAEYEECRDYVAGLLIATEAELIGIPQTDAVGLERLMVTYIDSTSKTRLNGNAKRRLNQYASRGMGLIREKLGGTPYKLEMFLLDFFSVWKMENSKNNYF